jgi:hypothetical protein
VFVKEHPPSISVMCPTVVSEQIKRVFLEIRHSYKKPNAVLESGLLLFYEYTVKFLNKIS